LGETFRRNLSKEVIKAVDILKQISQIPIWFILALLFLILLSILISLRTGREIHIWPPSIGPAKERFMAQKSPKDELEPSWVNG
jgi:hypothetical protein